MQQLTRRTVLGALGAGTVALAGCVSGDGDDNPGDDSGDDGTGGDGDDGTIDLETSVERVDSDCADLEPGEANVLLDEGTYLVEGTIPSPTPCYEPVVDSSAYDEGTLSLTVDVVEEDPDTACVECTGKVVYDATIEGVEPEEVDRIEVNHADGDSYTFEADDIPVAPPELIEATIESSSGRTRTEEDGGDWIDVGDIGSEPESDTGTISIDGGITTKTPHYEAVLTDAAVRGGTLAVSIDAESTLEDGQAGTQPLGIVEYTATAEIRHVDSIDSVQVEHPDSSHGVAWDSASESDAGGSGGHESDSYSDEDGYSESGS